MLFTYFLFIFYMSLFYFFQTSLLLPSNTPPLLPQVHFVLALPLLFVLSAQTYDVKNDKLLPRSDLHPTTNTIYLNVSCNIIMPCDYGSTSHHRSPNSRFSTELIISVVRHYHRTSTDHVSSTWVCVLQNVLFYTEKGTLLMRKPRSTSKNEAGRGRPTHLSVSTSVLALWVPGLVLCICPWTPSPITLPFLDCFPCIVSLSLSSCLLSCLQLIDKHIE